MGTNSISVTMQNQTQLIANGLITADKFINKSYLIDISSSDVVPLKEDFNNTKGIRLYQIEKLVYDKEENINDKLISVYSSLLNINSSALLVISGEEKSVSFYIGIRSTENTAIAGVILEKSFLGNFPGSLLRRLRNDEIEEVMHDCVESSSSLKNVSCVTVVPSMRDENKDKFVQGLEKFVDTMQGSKYTAVLIAQPVNKYGLEQRKRGLEEMYSALSPLAKTNLSYAENFSEAVTTGINENFSHSVNSSINITNGSNTSESYSRSSGMNIGIMGSGINSGSSRSYTTGQSWSRAVTKGTADTTSTGTSTSTAITTGNTRTFSAEHQNKSVASLMEKLDEQLKRIKDCEGFGIWDCACYFVADDIQTSVVAANTYKALMLGDNTSVENSYVNVWDYRVTEANRRNLLSYIKSGIHPVINVNSESGYTSQIVTPGSYISGKELPFLIGMPRKSIPGVPVNNIAEFGRNVFIQNAKKDRTTIHLGNVHHMGNTEKNSVDLDLNSFTSHCFITGSTGSGKSNTTYCLLEKFYQNNIPFLVIEPAKGEYKDAFGALEGVNVFSTNPYIGQMLKLNPFSFAPQIHILEHLDRLIEIFNACWEMYAAMPAILKDAIEKIYIDKGWDLLNSVYLGEGEPVFPTFSDLMKTLPNIINSSDYSSDTKGDYIGALVTRVTSLTNGISGQIFCDNYDVPDSVLFDENTIVDLSRVGSAETKSLIMGLLVLKLTEYRMANAVGANSQLRHITVLEEAHNLLKKSSNEAAGSNVVGKSVEMICNSIAEMRTYGEGFIIVDQSPTAVDIAAIKNTNTKIIMRLPERNDCEAVGNAVGLNDKQKAELSKLETGVAVVMQNNWLEAVLTHIDRFSGNYETKIPVVPYESLKVLKSEVVKELMNQYIVDRTMNLDRMLECIDAVDISVYKKQEMRHCMSNIYKRLSKGRNVDTFSETLYNLIGANSLFDVIEPTILPSNESDAFKYSKDSVHEWRTKLNKSMERCLALPDEYVHTLIDYLLYIHEEKMRKIDYYEIQRILEQDVK